MLPVPGQEEGWNSPGTCCPGLEGTGEGEGGDGRPPGGFLPPPAGSGQGPGSRCQRRQPRRWHQRTALASPGRELAHPGGCSPLAGGALG